MLRIEWRSELIKSFESILQLWRLGLRGRNFILFLLLSWFLKNNHRESVENHLLPKNLQYPNQSWNPVNLWNESVKVSANFTTKRNLLKEFIKKHNVKPLSTSLTLSKLLGVRFHGTEQRYSIKYWNYFC